MARPSGKDDFGGTGRPMPSKEVRAGLIRWQMEAAHPGWAAKAQKAEKEQARQKKKEEASKKK